ncbi:MAG: hypothetical protein ACW98X_22200 [Promethearchaeota archaeon]|jgi:hypothetical protein
MPEINQVSDFKVMKSNAGFYIGRTEYQFDIDAEFPYSRDSQYFNTKEQANASLKYFKLIGNLREHL